MSKVKLRTRIVTGMDDMVRQLDKKVELIGRDNNLADTLDPNIVFYIKSTKIEQYFSEVVRGSFCGGQRESKKCLRMTSLNVQFETNSNTEK
jgi:hypothetical protein